MRDYELVLVLDTKITGAKQKTLIDKVKKVVENGKGKVNSVDEWGKKELAYPIKKQTEAIYFLLQLELPPEALKKLEDSLRIEENVLRHLLVSKS